MQSFAAGHINDVDVGRGNRDGAYGLRGLLIEDRFPCPAVVVRLPDASVYLSDVEQVRLVRNSSRGASASAAKGPDHAPPQVLIGVFGNLLCAARYRGQESEDRNHHPWDPMESDHVPPPACRNQTTQNKPTA